MTLSTQLRLIILAAGGLMLLIIYLLGRRRNGVDEAVTPRVSMDVPRTSQTFDDVAPLVTDEDEFDEPSYLRRSAKRDVRDDISVHDVDEDSMPLPSVRIDSTFEPRIEVPPAASPITMRIPVLSMQDPDKTQPMKVDTVLPSTTNVEVINETVTALPSANATVQRHLVALRLVMSEAVSGEQLFSMFQSENLQHGKFNIFHRMHSGETLFSVASLVEPGSFDLSTMPSQVYRGISLFMLLPGPMPGLQAFEEMLSCAQRLAQLTSGIVQDEGGVMLLESGIERMRDKVRDFEHSLQE